LGLNERSGGSSRLVVVVTTNRSIELAVLNTAEKNGHLIHFEIIPTISTNFGTKSRRFFKQMRHLDSKDL